MEEAEAAAARRLKGEAENGEVEGVAMLLDQHPGLISSSQATAGGDALLAAAQHGRTEVVWLLLDRGAKVDSRDGRGRTALYCAAQAGHDEVVTLLLKRGADTTIKTTSTGSSCGSEEEGGGRTALMAACAEGRVKAAKALLRRPARSTLTPSLAPGEGTRGQQQPQPESLGLVAVVEESGAMEEEEEEEEEALWLACLHGHTDMVRLLLVEGGVDPSRALHHYQACWRGAGTSLAKRLAGSPRVALLKLFKSEADRAYHLFKARCCCMHHREHQQGSGEAKADDGDRLLQLPAYRRTEEGEKTATNPGAASLLLPRVSLVATPTAVGSKRTHSSSTTTTLAVTTQEEEQEERSATLRFVVEDLPLALFQELHRALLRPHA